VNDEDVGHGEQSSATGDTAPTTENLAIGAQSCEVNSDTAVEASSRPRRQAAVLGEATRRVWTGQ